MEARQFEIDSGARHRRGVNVGTAMEGGLLRGELAALHVLQRLNGPSFPPRGVEGKAHGEEGTPGPVGIEECVAAHDGEIEIVRAFPVLEGSRLGLGVADEQRWDGEAGAGAPVEWVHKERDVLREAVLAENPKSVAPGLVGIESYAIGDGNSRRHAERKWPVLGGEDARA